MEPEEGLEFLEGPAVRVHDVDPDHAVLLDELPAASDGHVVLFEKVRRRVGHDLNADHRGATLPGPI
ncbi:MAG: hypothetical protein A3K59_10360 [Euryarchaeota archaeon RBG_19FT_COMBO_69_17]|nr:MAG: hypothetical protein A3K59_10360 [Euryarchaeota archaeon RBG_19FT_COMBO_69_17]